MLNSYGLEFATTHAPCSISITYVNALNRAYCTQEFNHVTHVTDPKLAAVSKNLNLWWKSHAAYNYNSPQCICLQLSMRNATWMLEM